MALKIVVHGWRAANSVCKLCLKDRKIHDIFTCNSSMRPGILITLDRNVSSRQLNDAIVIHFNWSHMCSCTTLQNWKHGNKAIHIFT